MATKQRRLFLSGLWMMVILVAVYYSHAPEHAVATPTAQVDSIDLKAMPQSRAAGLQWMGALKTSAVDVLHLAPIDNQPTDVELEAIATKLSP